MRIHITTIEGDKIESLFHILNSVKKCYGIFIFFVWQTSQSCRRFIEILAKHTSNTTEHEVRVQISRHAAHPPAIKLDTATQLRGCSETRCSTRQRKRRSSGGCGDKRVLSGAFLAPNASSCGTGSRNGLRLRRPHRRTAPRVIAGGKQNAQVNKVF